MVTYWFPLLYENGSPAHISLCMIYSVTIRGSSPVVSWYNRSVNNSIPVIVNNVTWRSVLIGNKCFMQIRCRSGQLRRQDTLLITARFPISLLHCFLVNYLPVLMQRFISTHHLYSCIMVLKKPIFLINHICYRACPVLFSVKYIFFISVDCSTSKHWLSFLWKRLKNISFIYWQFVWNLHFYIIFRKTLQPSMIICDLKLLLLILSRYVILYVPCLSTDY